jgi:GNAT superfamily N-acetyltransferase
VPYGGKVDNLYRLHKHEIAQAGLALDDAFQDDPVFGAIFSGAAPEQRIAFYTMTVQYGMKYGHVIAPSSHLEGIAVWVPGKYAEMNLLRLVLSGAFWSGMKMGNEISQKIATVFSPIDQDRRALMQGRNFTYLLLIGVSPQCQGLGLGKKLLNALFADSEQTGLPIYLETETEENVRIYEHLGFSVLNLVTLPLIDLPMWEMIREPDVEPA